MNNAMNNVRKKDPPVVKLTKSRKIHCQALLDYYERKIECLLNFKMPPKLVALACWDAPIEREDLGSQRQQRRFVKQCLRYYKKQLREMEKEIKKF